MKKGKIISFDQLQSATRHVQNELHSLGLWHSRSRLLKTDVIWCRLPQVMLPLALGFCIDGEYKAGSISEMVGRYLAYEPGHIYIPSVVLGHLFWQNRGSLRDVIRHEYAHAIAYHYPQYVKRSRKFREVFGGDYDGKRLKEIPEPGFVSEYAMRSPAEDFAETFMYYLKNRKNGKAKGLGKILREKVRFVRWLIGNLSQSLAIIK